jgi:hypothetical protein
MPRAASGQVPTRLKRSKGHPSFSIKAPKRRKENNKGGTWKMNEKACRMYACRLFESLDGDKQYKDIKHFFSVYCIKSTSRNVLL